MGLIIKYCGSVLSACSPAGWRSSLAVPTSSRAATPSRCDVFLCFLNTVSFTWSVEERRERHRGTDGQWVTDERERERGGETECVLDLHTVTRQCAACHKEASKEKTLPRIHTVLANHVEHTEPTESDGFPRIPSPLVVHFIHSFHSRELASNPSPLVIAPDPSFQRHLVSPSANVASSVVKMQHQMLLFGLKDCYKLLPKDIVTKTQFYIYRIIYILCHVLQNRKLLVAAERLVTVLYGNESW